MVRRFIASLVSAALACSCSVGQAPFLGKWKSLDPNVADIEYFQDGTAIASRDGIVLTPKNLCQYRIIDGDRFESTAGSGDKQIVYYKVEGDRLTIRYPSLDNKELKFSRIKT